MWTRSLTRPVSRTVRLSTGNSAGAPGLFRVDAVTSPCRSEDATPGSRAGVRVLVLPGRVGRAGLPGTFWCASPFPPAPLFFRFAWPTLGWGCPFRGPLLALPLFSPLPPPFFFRAPPLCLAFFGFRPRVPQALALCFSFPPPRACGFFSCAPPLSPAFSDSRPRVSRALALCAFCCVGLQLLSSPCSVALFLFPTRLLAAPWWLPPLPFRVSRFSWLPLCARFFFFRPRCHWLSLVSGSGALGLGAVGSFALWASRLSAPRARSPCLCVPPPYWRLSGGCCPPHPTPFCHAVFAVRCSVFFPLFRSVPPLSLPPLSLAFPGLPSRVPRALALCVVCFAGLPCRLAVHSPLFCVSRLAAGCPLVVAAPPPPFASRGFRRCLSVLGFFSFVRPRCLWLSLVSCPVALGLGAVGCLFCLPPASLLSVRSRLVCVSRLAVAALWWLLLPPPTPFCRAVFVARCSVFCFSFFLRSFVPRPRCLHPRYFWLSLVSSPGCPGPWHCVMFVLVGSPAGSLCALASFVFPAWPLAAPWWLLPPPPLNVAVFVAASRSRVFFCAPVPSGLLWFPAPGALGLGAVCCLFCWPPASRLAVRSRLFCGFCPAVGCSVVFAPPPPPAFVSRGFRCFLLVLSFSFFFVVRPRCLWLFLVSGPGCPGPWRCVLFASRAAGCAAPCFVWRHAVWCCGLWCVVWRACVWLGSCAALWWVLLCCFCCALLLCVAVFPAGFFFVVPCLSVVLRAVVVVGEGTPG